MTAKARNQEIDDLLGSDDDEDDSQESGPKPIRFLDIEDVTHRTGMSQSTIRRAIKDDDFPRPMKIRGSLKFVETEIEDWQRQVMETCR